ncbi:hypothetical protein OROMI_031426 [Orobanche minor]
MAPKKGKGKKAKGKGKRPMPRERVSKPEVLKDPNYEIILRVVTEFVRGECGGFKKLKFVDCTDRWRLKHDLEAKFGVEITPEEMNQFRYGVDIVDYLVPLMRVRDDKVFAAREARYEAQRLAALALDSPDE